MFLRAIAVLVLACAGISPQPAEYPPWFREAIELGRTQDEKLFEAFTKGYSLSPSGIIDSAEVITEFRRAVLIVHERARMGNFSLSQADLAKALAPYLGLVTFVVQVRLNPMNTFTASPPYDLYVSTGPDTPPLSAKPLKRDPVYPPGGALGSPVVAVRLEASFPAAAIMAAPLPQLIVTDEKAEILWQARLDLTRFR
jgi:hypothetical protein